MKSKPKRKKAAKKPKTKRPAKKRKQQALKVSAECCEQIVDFKVHCQKKLQHLEENFANFAENVEIRLGKQSHEVGSLGRNFATLRSTIRAELDTIFHRLASHDATVRQLDAQVMGELTRSMGALSTQIEDLESLGHTHFWKSTKKERLC